VIEPREAINPGEYRRPPIPEWTLGYDPTLRAYTPVPVDPAPGVAPECGYENDTRGRVRPPRKKVAAPVDCALGIETQISRVPSQSEAIRRLIEIALTTKLKRQSDRREK
jgi:hypothetical protein